MRGAISAALMTLAVFGASGALSAAEAPAGYASLDADKVNMRTGPGLRYPVQWVFKRQGWPVEIISEFGYWRKVRDIDGTTGWIHQNLLSGRRRAIVTGEMATVHVATDPGSATVMRLKRGVVATLGECRPDWCWVTAADREGWVDRDVLWGVAGTDSP